jgi:hypothetical protein
MNAQLKCARCAKLFTGSDSQMRKAREGRTAYCGPACRNAAARDRFAQPVFRGK